VHKNTPSCCGYSIWSARAQNTRSQGMNFK